MKKTSIALLALLSMSSLVNAEYMRPVFGPDGKAVEVATEHRLKTMDFTGAQSALIAAIRDAKKENKIEFNDPSTATLVLRAKEGQEYQLNEKNWPHVDDALKYGATLGFRTKDIAAKLPVYPMSM